MINLHIEGTRQVKVRVIAASNRDLKKDATEGSILTEPEIRALERKTLKRH
jgi:DNA-binding NtrC family response regulator